MATKESGWYARHSATVTESNSSASVLVKAYWQNDGWTYQIGWLNAWVYCNGSKVQVASNGAIDTTSSSTASQKLGEHTYTINKTTSKQSIPCKCKIESTGTYVQGTKYSTEANVSISALASYTVSYNANGGSGAPGNQTKWYGQTLTLSSSVPSRTGHTFAGWNTNSSGTGTNYSAGASYTSNAALTLYAKWTPHTYTVSYNANGGSGAPGNQTKTYGVNLTLSSTKPTRTNYNFLGWSTSASGGVVYASGATYTNNSAVTLYAVWELAYVKPRLNNFNAYRCDSAGNASESGTYVKVTFSWATDRTVSDIKIEHKTQAGSTWTQTSVSASGTSGSVSQVIGGGEISTETSYQVRAYVSDSGGTTYSTTIAIGTVKFPIDFKAGGTGVAIGKVAESDNLFDIALPTNIPNINNNIHWNTYGENSNANNCTQSGSYYLGSSATNCPGGYGYSRLLVSGYNAQGDIAQIGMPVSYNELWFRTSSNGTWHPWTKAMPVGEPVSYASARGSWNAPTRGVITVQTDNSGAQHSAIVGLSSTGARLYGMDLLDSDGSPQMRFYVGSRYLGIDSSANLSTAGTLSLGNPMAHSNIGVSLYTNSSGTAGTVTLSQSAANFSYLEIYFAKGTDQAYFASTKVVAPNGRRAALITGYGSGTQALTYYKAYNISGTSMTVNQHGRGALEGTACNCTNSKDYVYVYKVIGYK